MYLDRRKQSSDYVAAMGNKLFQAPAFKECLDQEQYHQLQNLLHHESNDGRLYLEPFASHQPPFSPICKTRVGSEVSPGFCDPNVSCSGFNYSKASNNACMIRLNTKCTSRYLQQSSNDYHKDSSMSVEQISSITACSDAKQKSGDKELSETGATFAVGSFFELPPGDNVGVDARLSEHISPQIKEDINALSSMAFNTPELSHEQLSQYRLQALQSKQCHMQSFPPHISLEAQAHWRSVDHNMFYNEAWGERLPKLSQLPLEQSHSFQQQGFHNARASRPTDSIRFLHNILVLYLKYKSKLLDAGRSQQELLNHLHLTVCKVRICECNKYRMLLSHFDGCHNTACNKCGPVRQLCRTKRISLGPVCEPCPTKKIIPGLGTLKEYISVNLHPRDHIIQDMQSTSKRMKVENDVQHDDWSLGAVVFPFMKQHLNDEDNTKNMNKEVLSSEKAPTAAAVWNATADNGGSKIPSVCFRKLGGLLGLRQPPEGSINSTTLSKEVPSSISEVGINIQTLNDACDNEIMRNGDAISHPEELYLVDEQPEMGCSVVKDDVTFSCQSLSSDGLSVLPEVSPIDEGENTKLMTQAELDTANAKYDLANSDHHFGRKVEDLKVSGVSLTDFFTAEQIKEHLCSLNHSFNQNAGKELSGNMTAPVVGPNTCQLCTMDCLTFTAPAMYCTSCGAQIKRKLIYYWSQDGMGARSFFCTKCFKESRGGNISFRGLSVSKATLYKDKNTEESGEAWVQCDKCKKWQHQICALYNTKQDIKGKVKYICPFCRLAEIEANVHVSIPPASGARDLPRTKLSDHIEQRLFRRLKQERKQRAKISQKHPEEVSGASDLIVRVVLAVNKQLKVNQQFLDILPNENYPTEFPYKSKVILLFQKIEGADVCLFAMYVQEFGSECGNPNKRSVYISYLDSVKYFRPEIRTITGVALRTFVYHEILIGYLDYCKRHGFASCYIWACPSSRGDDYILNCHPGNQKRPNSNKLIQWYKKMLRKAKDEMVVVDFTNFYDYFFVPSGESNCRITASRLPYFDGDYWSAAIEDIIETIEKDGRGNSEGQLKHQMTKRTLKAMGHSDLSVDTTKDILVMQKLGHRILASKEDIIVVHLQFNCTNCHEAILSGGHWSCKRCSKFHLCGRCLELERFPSGLETHTDIHGEKHPLYLILGNDAAADTENMDGVSDNNIFDNRHSFLKFCEKNFYQFDTLRRAKHSSMMILHHLHTSTHLRTTSIIMEAICRICNQDAKVGWHCEICSQFDVCNACYEKEGDGCHVHKLVQHLKIAETSEQMQQHRAPEVRMVLDLLKHANQCSSTKDNPCSYPKCLNIKKLFLHSRECKRHMAGGCNDCRKIWHVLYLHSQNCTDSYCNIPRCKDIRNRKK